MLNIAILGDWGMPITEKPKRQSRDDPAFEIITLVELKGFEQNKSYD